MKLASLRLALCANALLLAAGCGLGSKAMNESDFCEAYAKRECEMVVMICQKPDPAPCEQIRQAACRQFVAQAKGVDRAFRSDNVDACLQQVSKTYTKTLIKAEDLASLRATCARVFAGHAKANDACTQDVDCEASLICDRKRCGPPRMIASGGNCGNPGETCISGEYCRPADGISVCTKSKDKGAVCSAAEPCLPALRCDGTCVERVPNDGLCQADGDCQSAYCDPYPLANMARTCALGLSFARFSPSCDAYFGTSSTTGTPVGADAGAYMP